MNNNLYNEKLDNKFYLKNDYGFSFIMNDVKIGIFPYFIEKLLYQRSYDSTTKIGKTKN